MAYIFIMHSKPETDRQMASDIVAGNWVERLAPDAVLPYLRLARIDRPIGTWLLLLPCWWSLALATLGWPDGWMFALFAIGALVMRGAGCTLNDIADRDFDARVARTALRPIPGGAVSVRRAAVFMVLLALAGLLVLIQFNSFAIGVGVASLGLVAIYPFMKRITYWPQAVLGLAFNYGALLGWAAVRGDLGLAPVVLYGAGICWTLGYDTIYAHQDKGDDLLIGVKSTALRFGSATKVWVSGFFAATVLLLVVAGWLVGLAWPFFALLVVAAGHFVWQVITLDIDCPANCLARFRANRDLGLIIMVAIITGQLAG